MSRFVLRRAAIGGSCSRQWIDSGDPFHVVRDHVMHNELMMVAELPTHGYRRVNAILKRRALAAGLKPANHKRVYRVMKVHGLLLHRHASGAARRYDGRIAVNERNRHWCSDSFEIGCDNGKRMRVAFALDCCDREASHGLPRYYQRHLRRNMHDLMVATVEQRFW